MTISEQARRLLGDKRRWRAYKQRTRALPHSHRTAVEGIERYLLRLGPADGDSATSMLETLVDVFERGAARGTPVDEIVGDAPVAFAESLFEDRTANTWMTKEQHRLTRAIARARRTEEGGR